MKGNLSWQFFLWKTQRMRWKVVPFWGIDLCFLKGSSSWWHRPVMDHWRRKLRIKTTGRAQRRRTEKFSTYVCNISHGKLALYNTPPKPPKLVSHSRIFAFEFNPNFPLFQASSHGIFAFREMAMLSRPHTRLWNLLAEGQYANTCYFQVITADQALKGFQSESQSWTSFANSAVSKVFVWLMFILPR